jgi:nucleotide-binding universal stress UspA family protein
VAYDGSPPSVAALDQAAEIARSTKAELTIVGVLSLVSQGFGVSMPAGDSAEHMIEDARRALTKEKERMAAEGLPHVATQFLEGDPVAGVVGYVETHPTDLVVVGTRGLDALGRFFLGSVSDGIVHHTSCSVLVVKSPHPSPKGPAREAGRGARNPRGGERPPLPSQPKIIAGGPLVGRCKTKFGLSIPASAFGISSAPCASTVASASGSTHGAGFPTADSGSISFFRALRIDWS